MEKESIANCTYRDYSYRIAFHILNVLCRIVLHQITVKHNVHRQNDVTIDKHRYTSACHHKSVSNCSWIIVLWQHIVMEHELEIDRFRMSGNALLSNVFANHWVYATQWLWCEVKWISTIIVQYYSCNEFMQWTNIL